MKKIISATLTLILVLSALTLVSCQNNRDENTIVIGASSTPHAEILEFIADDLAAQGYTLKIKIYDDYILPNTGVNDGTLDANYFQHTPYLNSFNRDNGTDIVSAGLVHYEPYGIYGNGVTSLSQLAEGALIIIPADDSNETRALFLLAQEGLITLPETAGAETGVTTLDIVDDGGYRIVPVEAQTVPAQLKNSDKGSIAVINGNYAIGAGLKISEALATESTDGAAARTYANIIAVKRGNETTDKIRALIAALQSDKVAEFISTKYNGAVVAIR